VKLPALVQQLVQLDPDQLLQALLDPARERRARTALKQKAGQAVECISVTAEAGGVIVAVEAMPPP
jgi:hypothetical protein